MSAFKIPLPTDQDFALEAEIDTAVELIEAATSTEERDSGVDALAKLVRSRTDEQAVRVDIQRRERRSKA
jgi:hypothetical protein